MRSRTGILLASAMTAALAAALSGCDSNPTAPGVPSAPSTESAETKAPAEATAKTKIGPSRARTKTEAAPSGPSSSLSE